MLAQFCNISIEAMMDKCTELMTTPIEKVVNEGVITCFEIVEMPTIETKVKSAPRKAVLYHKFLFLSHLIITKCCESKDNKVQLHTERIKNVLGSDYTYLIETLCSLGLITITSTFVIGERCRYITLKDWNIKYESSPNLKVIEYLTKWNELTDKSIAFYSSDDVELKIVFVDGKLQIIKQGGKEISEYDKWLYACYNDSLSCLKLRVEKDGALGYIDTLFSDKNTHKYNHSRYKILSFDKKDLSITSIDKQDRIYNYLTNLKKELKPLFNIKYQLDIANSHPLLLCKLLINKYKIEDKILDIIYCRKGGDIDILHNVSEQLYNELEYKNIHIPIDVIRFIYACSNGLIWNELQSAFPELSREEIKNKAFAQIFYNERNIARYTAFGQRFIEVYPNVYSVIAETKDITKLPHLMMKVESRMIRKVLAECYKRGFKVISIHDAIIILNTPQNDSITPNDIIGIIKEIYHQAQLCPMVHCDEFSINI